MPETKPTHGTLYVVATPIGNLEDITLRALRILREADLIAAEDTRVTRKLLSHFDIHTPLTSYHQHTRGEKAETMAAQIVQGKNIALVSDAGLPGISDPGGDLVALAIAAGVAVVPIPGPNAALSALIVSGLPTGRFAFEGFPPRTKTERRTFFQSLSAETQTTLLYEAPTRLLVTLEELYTAVGERPIAVARELTKLFEEVYRGTLSGALAHFREHRPRGEFTLVLGGASKDQPKAAEESAPETEMLRLLREALHSGTTPRDAIQNTAVRLNLPRRLVYRAYLEMTDLEGQK